MNLIEYNNALSTFSRFYSCSWEKVDRSIEQFPLEYISAFARRAETQMNDERCAFSRAALGIGSFGVHLFATLDSPNFWALSAHFSVAGLLVNDGLNELEKGRKCRKEILSDLHGIYQSNNDPSLLQNNL